MTNQANAMKMALQTWRGYSAYEIAVQNGFEGTQQQWLQSLHGTNGQTTSVNGVEQFEGNIDLTGADIRVSPSDVRKLSEIAAKLDTMMDMIRLTQDSVDLGGRYVDNGVFR